MTTEVFFVTNRKVKEHNQDQQPINFGTEINNDSERPLHFGKAIVSGENELEEVNTPRDIISEDLCYSQNIFNEIQDSMLKGIDTIIFFHGFNNTFKSAITEAAELKRLYEQEGSCDYTMIVFSWPSEGNPFAYSSDRYDALRSRTIFGPGLYKIGQFLTNLCQPENNQKIILDTVKNENLKKQNNKTNYGRLHIMAHSMGNYVLSHTLQEFYKIKGDKISQLFDEVLLIAADEDADSFENNYKLKLLPEVSKRVSVYFNQEDFPLKISKRFMGNKISNWLISNQIGDWLMGNIVATKIFSKLLLKIGDVFTGNMDRLGSEGPSQPHNIPTNVFLINCEDVVSGVLEHDYHKTELSVYRDISYILTGWKSEDIPGRVYNSETNSYYLIKQQKQKLIS